MSTPLFEADLSRAPLGLQVRITLRLGPDGRDRVEVDGQHVGAGLVLHPDPDQMAGMPPLWIVSDGVSGLYVYKSQDPLHAMWGAYRRLIEERARPEDLNGSVVDAVRAILVRVRLALHPALRSLPSC